MSANRTFAESAARHVRALQASMTELLEEAGLARSRPAALGRTFGVDKTLAWRVSRFVTDDDVRGAARHLPGIGGMEIVLKAAEKHGVAATRVKAVREAESALQAFVQQHAGDRRTFEAMLAGVAHDDRADLDERRAFYRAGSAIWGVRARCQFLLFASKPSEHDVTRLDTLDVAGFQDLERLRPDVPWLVRRLHVIRGDGDSQSASTVSREPLDPDCPSDQVMPLLTEFCSKPIPRFHQFVGADGAVYNELAPGPLGRRNAVDCISGEMYRSMLARSWSPTNTFGRYTFGVRTPVQSATFDVLLHESLVEYGDMEGSVVAAIENIAPGSGVQGAGQRALLQEPAPATKLGSPPIMHTSRTRDYPAIVRRAFDLAGWSLDEFRGYRLELEYPPPPCTMILRCPISP